MLQHSDSVLTINNQRLDLNQPIVMGILNVTEDSFSDGGKYNQLDKALARAEAMLEAGASIIDIGGESTRPGAQPVSEDDELAHVIPVIEHLAKRDIAISIDTSKPKVMTDAVAAGAGLINDVCALQLDGALEAAVSAQVPVCLMHMQGTPRTMQSNPSYQDVVQEVKAFLQARAAAYRTCCQTLGLTAQSVILDPGFGFGKTLEHNFTLLNQLDAFNELQEPLLVGISRKSMLGAIINKPPEQRVSASVACAILAWQKGAQLFRVHDVEATVDALKMVKALADAQNSV